MTGFDPIKAVRHRTVTVPFLGSMAQRLNGSMAQWPVVRCRTRIVRSTLSDVFGGNVLLVQLVLAFAGAMFVGSVMALVRPPAKRPKGASLKVAPKGRTIAMAALGGFVSIWAIASLLTR